MSALFSLTRTLQSRGHNLLIVATASDLIALAAYSKDDIKRLYGAQIETYLEKYNTEKSVDDYIMLIYNADPTSDKKWMGQIAKWVLEKRPEELETEIKEYLNKFAEILAKNPGKFGGLAKQLAKGKVALADLKTVVQENQNKSESDLTTQDKFGGFQKVAENEKYACYKIDDWVEGPDNKHIAFQGNVNWCVKYEEHFNDHEPPYFMFIEKDTGKEYALFHKESTQLKNVKNKEITLKELEPIYDLLNTIEDIEKITRENDFIVFNLYDIFVKGKKNIKGNLNLQDTDVTELPEGLYVSGNLNLEGTPINSLPNDLTVRGYLNLEQSEITSLPKNFHVGGSLFLRGTPVLELPAGLRVGGHLDIRETDIVELPPDLQVGDKIYR